MPPRIDASRRPPPPPVERPLTPPLFPGVPKPRRFSPAGRKRLCRRARADKRLPDLRDRPWRPPYLSAPAALAPPRRLSPVPFVIGSLAIAARGRRSDLAPTAFSPPIAAARRWLGPRAREAVRNRESRLFLRP